MRLSAAAASLLVVWCLASPSRVEASCGDYVMVGGSHGTMSGGAHAQHGQPMPAGHDSDKPRCNGPLCRDGSLPPAAPAPRFEAAVEHWAISAEQLGQCPPESRVFCADQAERPVAGDAMAILRPPRS